MKMTSFRPTRDRRQTKLGSVQPIACQYYYTCRTTQVDKLSTPCIGTCSACSKMRENISDNTKHAPFVQRTCQCPDLVL
eukprot:480048-Pleurochrysis_carterae.AAC.1